MPVALGFRVKSGYAIAVALSGSQSSPTAVFRRTVDLSDPAVPATRQPYHAAMGTAREDPREIARLTKIVSQCARHSISRLLKSDELQHQRCCGARLVVGSLIDPARVGNPHIRAHASEGRLFRTVLEEALGDRHIRCGIVVDKTLSQDAARMLGRSEAEIMRQLADVGKTLGSPWRGDEKAAALAAWMTLTEVKL
jgi:hypothetical protein